MCKGPMDKDKGGGRGTRRMMGRAGESNGGKVGTTVIEQQFKKKKLLSKTQCYSTHFWLPASERQLGR